MEFLEGIGLNDQHVVIVGDSTWDGMMHPWHQLTFHLARKGTRVSFIRDAPMRPISLERILRRLGESTGFVLGRRFKRASTPLIEVFNPKFLPPSAPMGHTVNMHTALRLARSVLERGRPLLMIVFVPGLPVQKLIEELRPSVLIYISVHHYPSYDVPDEVVNSEIAICRLADRVFADSRVTSEYLAQWSASEVKLFLPGVDFAAFQRAYRGDEVKRKRKIGYYGTLLDYKHHVGFYNAAAAGGYDVEILGDVNRNARKLLAKNISIKAPVDNAELPWLLREWDIILLAYKESAYNKGLVPAKIFECFATGKPVVLTRIHEFDAFEGMTITFDTPQSFLAGLRDLTEEAFAGIRQKQIEASRRQDWATHLTEFETLCCEIILNKGHRTRKAL